MAHGNTIWSHPRATGPLNGLGDASAMAQIAADALAVRIATYPDLVKKEKMTAAETQADIAAWRVIADDWYWIASNGADGAASNHFTLPDRIAALDTAIERLFRIFDHTAEKAKRPVADVITPAQQQQITSYLAMRYWAQHERRNRYDSEGRLALHIRDYAQINAELRARKPAQPERKAA